MFAVSGESWRSPFSWKLWRRKKHDLYGTSSALGDASLDDPSVSEHGWMIPS